MPGSTLMESSPFLLLFLLGYCLAVIEGELRCYCNESGCVSTGYMCKSSAGQCFTAVEVRGEVTHQTHGCLDTLSEEHRASCKVGIDVVSATKASRRDGKLPLLLCCKEHMCNYIEDLDVSIILTPKYNGTFHRGKAPANEDNTIYSRNHHSNRDDDRDLWFKAAVIAVPIAGGFILVLLVLLAVRMLKTDSRHHRRLIQIRRERSLTKAHMFITDHFAGKSTKQHCSLFNEKTSKTCAPIYTDNPVTSSSGSSASGNTCVSSVYGDNSSKQCSYPFHNENNSQHESSTVHSCKGGNHSKHCHNYSMPCSSNFSDTSNLTCSKNGENHSKMNNSTVVKPCSFYCDNQSKTPSLTREISVKLDKGGHMFPQASRLDTGILHPGVSHQHSSVATWDGVCSKGPSAVV